jgi:hypothetical protein
MAEQALLAQIGRARPVFGEENCRPASCHWRFMDRTSTLLAVVTMQ